MTAPGPDRSDQASPEPPRFEYDPSPSSSDVPSDAPHEQSGTADPRPDVTTAIGVAVTLLALAGLCAVLGQHFLVGWLRLAAGVLAGAGAGALVLVALGRLHRAVALGAAGAVAVLLAAALTVPAVLSARPIPLEDTALASIPALADGDRVTSLPLPGSPVLVRRADGTAELLRGTRVDSVPTPAGALLALSADGTRLISVTGTMPGVDPAAPGEPTAETAVFDLSTDAAVEPTATLPGAPLALAGDLLVLRNCIDGVCRISGHDLSDEDPASQPARWTISDGEGDRVEDARGPDPADTVVPARAAQPPGLLDAFDQGGILPEVPLRFDPAQGWVQLDPATGFPLGSILAGPEQQCRIAATAPSPAPQTLQAPQPVVLTVCSEEDGAMTVTAFSDGAQLWESEPSPAGEWTVRLDQGRVLAAGTEAGTDLPGEIVAGEERAAWIAPGGPALEQASTFTSRIGIDGARMVITNDAGQLAAYDTAHGKNTWTHGVTGAGAGPEDDTSAVQGMLGAGSVVVLDPAERTAALDARDGRRLRVFDAHSGEVNLETVVAGSVEPVAAVGSGQALVTVGDRTLLLGR